MMAGGGLPTRGGGLVTRGGGIAQTASGTIIDSFERGNINPYTVNSGSFSVVNDSAGAVHGNYYARSTGGIIYSTPGDGLNAYFSQGNQARAFTHCEGSATERAWVLFRVVDNFNYWAARVDYDNGAFGLVKRTDSSGGNVTVREDSSIAPAADTDHAVDIGLASDDTITIGLVDPSTESTITTHSVTDSTHSGAEGIGWIVDGQGVNAARLEYYHLPQV